MEDRFIKSGIPFFIPFLLGFFVSTSYSQSFIEKDIYYNKIEIIPEQALHFSPNTSVYDVKYYRLKFDVNPGINYISGSVTTHFVPLGQDINDIHFDFKSNMTVDSVYFHDNKIPSGQISFTSDIELKIILGTTISEGNLDSITIYYKGIPESGGFGIFRTMETTCSISDTVMWTLSEPYGSKHWWPCKETLNDKADSIDMIIKTPSKYRVGSNGKLVSETVNGPYKTYHWHHGYPIPAYLVAFAIADYSVYTDTIQNPLGGEIEVLNYVFPCDSAYAASQTPKLDTIMKFFIDSFGQYPYVNEKYGHAQCRFGGGMEHSTMSFMGGFSITLMAHELAHQWFGDKITCGSWQDIWLNEGFATYLEGLTCEKGIGQQSWNNWKTGKINSVTSVADGSVFNPDTTTLGRIFNGRLSYNKGALLLHMLRWKMGDEAFFGAIRNYISDPELAYDFARTGDLITHLEAEYGASLAEFFDDWFYGEGWPEYDVSWTIDPVCFKLKINIQQEHSTGGETFFEMPVPILFSDGTHDTLLILNQDKPGDSLFFPIIDFIPTTSTFDPDLWMCAKHSTNQLLFVYTTTNWTGTVNNDWHNPGNWDCGIPDINTNVFIPEGTPLCIIKANKNGVCRSLFSQNSAALRVETSGELQIKN